jgi:Ran GTPase-activating protein (RanGAP) involved in mRNA processing and transport
LRTLDVSGNEVNDDGVRAVVLSRFLTKLHTLRLYANRIGDAGAADLAGSALFARMLMHYPDVDLRSNAIGPDGVRALAASPYLKHAKSLDVSANHLGDDGVRALAASKHITALRRLVLRQNRISDCGATALANSRLMGRLAFLDISANSITRKGVDALWANRRNFRTVLETGGNFTSTVPELIDRVRPSPGCARIGELLGRLPTQ